jgi:hypothetical protein
LTLALLENEILESRGRKKRKQNKIRVITRSMSVMLRVHFHCPINRSSMSFNQFIVGEEANKTFPRER